MKNFLLIFLVFGSLSSFAKPTDPDAPAVQGEKVSWQEGKVSGDLNPVPGQTVAAPSLGSFCRKILKGLRHPNPYLNYRVLSGMPLSEVVSLLSPSLNKEVEIVTMFRQPPFVKIGRDDPEYFHHPKSIMWTVNEIDVRRGKEVTFYAVENEAVSDIPLTLYSSKQNFPTLRGKLIRMSRQSPPGAVKDTLTLVILKDGRAVSMYLPDHNEDVVFLLRETK